ncbi:hypothetical protein [Bradyrhizobium sp. STM 3562]|uniref:hypothetical protein n=1 Tax=Bradyrhizobium sp. STM 3562 TaxID=578924 RepID=UPI00388F1A56
MWTSNYPGMSSMGKLMALSLVCTLAAAVLFQPVLMGRPRQRIPLTKLRAQCPGAGANVVAHSKGYKEMRNV